MLAVEAVEEVGLEEEGEAEGEAEGEMCIGSAARWTLPVTISSLVSSGDGGPGELEKAEGVGDCGGGVRSIGVGARGGGEGSSSLEEKEPSEDEEIMRGMSGLCGMPN